ncbi:Zinc finger protein CONSTANS-LIKE 3 [Nymphaea thermarum]|nr:Zinc finger protein CONSTANS-LIKE 3 [Nymphaea thermarum]
MSAKEIPCLWGSSLFDLDAFLPNSNFEPFDVVSSPEMSIQEGSCSVGAARAEPAVYGDSASLGSNTESDREASTQISLRNLSLDHILFSSWPGNKGCLLTNELYDQQNHYYRPHRYDARAMKKAFSAGDLHSFWIRTGLNSKSVQIDSGSENSSAEQGQAPVVRYSAEERRERIRRYQSKRAKRNFNRKVEYECRKVLADGRRRIRGRFARSEGAEKNQAATKAQKDEDDTWVELLQEDEAKFVSQIATGGPGIPMTFNHVPVSSSYGWESEPFLR